MEKKAQEKAGWREKERNMEPKESRVKGYIRLKRSFPSKYRLCVNQMIINTEPV